jgi:hypothetical protein
MIVFSASDLLIDAFESMHSLWVIPVVGVAIAALAWYVGRQFFLDSAPASYNFEEDAMQPALSGLTTDRRASPRREGQEIEVWVTDTSEAIPCLGYVRNRSIGGLCLSVPQPFLEGTLIRVKPRHSSDASLWIPMIVRKCRANRGSWELGCQFQQTPSYNVLLLFG